MVKRDNNYMNDCVKRGGAGGGGGGIGCLFGESRIEVMEGF